MFDFMANGKGRQGQKAFATAALAAGVRLISPFKSIERGFEVDLGEIKNGHEKKILRDLLKERTGLETPRKYPLPRPTKYWKELYGPIQNEEFYEDAYARSENDEQAWIVYTLDHWLALKKKNLL